uniref:Transcription factor E2F8 n=1 Tax=Anabas testudineus TaxID=64144 RepID=A0AAQ6IE60_ANATE
KNIMKTHVTNSVLESVEDQLAMGPLTTPKKGREVGSVDPWTPTSNLKMLISAASPDIRNREKELCMDNGGREGLESIQETENGEESEKMVSRKEKSLGLLCHKFLARYPDYPDPSRNNDICLDDVATELNVERRRIYDIMNVLESLHMVSRSAKNRYSWHGRTKLAQTLAILKQVGEEHRYSQQMQQIRQRLLDKEFDFDGEEKENDEALDLEGGDQGQKELFFIELPGVEFKAASVNSRKDKSLRVMSQKFVMLFLVSNPRVVSLDVAAKILIGEDQVADQDKNKFKTKVRRLYDIANVLRSLKLIEKVHVTEERGRKPAFEWVGPEEFPQIKGITRSPLITKSILTPSASVDNCAKNLFSSPRDKRSFTRHPSLIKLAKSIQDDRRKINSAPNSPVRSDSSDIPNKMAQLAAICKIKLDQESVPGVNTTVNPNSHTPLTAQPAGSVAYIPAQCSPLIPILLPHQQGSGPYAVYLQPSSLRRNPLARPQPTSLAVRSMTFEDKTGQSPTGQTASMSQLAARESDISPLALKRQRLDSASEKKRLDSFILSSIGSRPAPVQEITPTSLRLHRPASSASPRTTQHAHQLHSPSPAILNFTLQNLGLISGPSPGSAFAAPQTPEHANVLSSPLALPQRGMVFIKPVSPVPVQQSVSPQPVTLISVQQPLMTTPKGTGFQHSFFHTPVPLSPLTAVVTTGGQPAAKTVYIPQRKLDVATEDS